MKTYLPGKYRCKVTEQSFTKAKTGTHQFELRFVPEGRYNDQTGELEACAADERTIFRPITEKTVDGIFQDLDKLFGYTDTTFSRLDPGHQECFSLVGMEFDAQLDYETWNQKERERWRWLAGNGRPQGQLLDSDDIRKLDTMFARNKKPNGKQTNTKRAAKAPF
jgi:hypothetical protein